MLEYDCVSKPYKLRKLDYYMLEQWLIISRYQEQEDRVKRLKEETIKAIMKNSADIVNFKREVSDRLSYLQQVAEEG